MKVKKKTKTGTCEPGEAIFLINQYFKNKINILGDSHTTYIDKDTDSNNTEPFIRDSNLASFNKILDLIVKFA